jgi:hypothetical protein
MYELFLFDKISEITFHYSHFQDSIDQEKQRTYTICFLAIPNWNYAELELNKRNLLKLKKVIESKLK